MWALMALIMAGLAIVAASGCGGDDDDEGPAVGDEEHGGDASELTVSTSEGDGLSFQPAVLEATAGSRVSLTLDNGEGSTLHDWTIEEITLEDVSVEGAGHEPTQAEATQAEHGGATEEEREGEYDLHVAAEAGESAVLSFTPTEAGSYTFYCTVDGHREAGMEGTLTVEE
ncbi:MAG: cupredoxin domain-containing protein [Dehalococcoidia bacterium]